MQYNPVVTDRSADYVMQAANTQANMYNRLGSDIGGALASIGEMYGEFQDKKQGAMALDQAMGMAADENLISYDSLEKFRNLPWRQKKPVFDLMASTIVPIAANRMKTSDRARIWSQYRGTGAEDFVDL